MNILGLGGKGDGRVSIKRAFIMESLARLLTQPIGISEHAFISFTAHFKKE